MGELLSDLIQRGIQPDGSFLCQSTPACFGEERSQALIGVQMASAYVGTCLMPPLFGLLAEHISITLLPVFLLIILVLMFVMYEKMLRAVKHSHCNS